MPRKKKTPWQKIIKAGREGKWLTLSPEETYDLSFDGAIEQRAAIDDENDIDPEFENKWEESLRKRRMGG